MQGRKIACETLDDAFDPSRARDNTTMLIKQRNVLALFGNSGTAEGIAAPPVVNETGTAGRTGDRITLAARTLHKPVFHVRACYRDELAKIVDHAHSAGTRRVAMLHTDDALGKLAAAESAELLRQKRSRWPA